MPRRVDGDAPRSPRGRSIQSRPPSPRAKAAVASASAQVRWGPSTVTDASASGGPPGPAVPQVAPPLGLCPTWRPRRRGGRRRRGPGRGGAGRPRRSAMAARCPAAGRPAVHGPAGRRRPRRTSARARPRRARPRRARSPSPSRSRRDRTGRAARDGGRGRRRRSPAPTRCTASRTSTTSAGPSSGWRSPRLMALMTLSARYVLKMASSRSSSASTAVDRGVDHVGRGVVVDDDAGHRPHRRRDPARIPVRSLVGIGGIGSTAVQDGLAATQR